MFSMCSELAPRAHIPDTRIPQLMQPWQVDPISVISNNYNIYERSRQGDFGSSQQKDQEETEDTVELFKRNGTDNHLYSY